MTSDSVLQKNVTLSPIFASIQEGVAIAWRNRKRLALAFAIPVVLALLAQIVLPNHYVATASILVKNGPEYLAREEGQVNGQAAPQVTKQEVINSEVELMTSPETIQQTIEALGGVAHIYPSIAKHPPAVGTPMDAAIKQFLRKLSVTAVKVSYVIDVSFTGTSAEEAVRVLQTFIAVDQRRHQQIYGGTGDADVFKADIATELDDLEQLQKQLTTLKLANGIYDIDQQRQSLIAQRAAAEDQLEQSRQQRATLTARVAFLVHTAGDRPSMQRTTETDKTDGLGTLTGVLADLKSTESQQLARYSPDHPLVVQTQNQIKVVQSEIDAQAGSFTHVKMDPNPLAQQVDQELVLDRTELAPLDQTVATMVTNVQGFSDTLQRLEAADMQQRVLVSRVASIDENLKFLRTEYAKARENDDLDKARQMSLMVMQSPMAPDVPTFPSLPLFLAIGIILGGVVAGGVFTSMVLTNDTLLTFQSLEHATGLRVIAVLRGSNSLVQRA